MFENIWLFASGCRITANNNGSFYSGDRRLILGCSDTKLKDEQIDKETLLLDIHYQNCTPDCCLQTPRKRILFSQTAQWISQVPPDKNQQTKKQLFSKSCFIIELCPPLTPLPLITLTLMLLLQCLHCTTGLLA